MKYVPILRAKSGEFRALEDQLFDSKTAMTPLLQLVPDTAENRVKNYLTTQVNAIKKAWGFKGNRVFLDPTLYYEETIDQSFPYFDALNDEGIHCIPVISLNSPDNYINFLKENGRIRYGVCIRIKQDFAIPRLVNMTINHYKQEFGIESDQIDLLIDFGYLGETSNSHYLNSFQRIYESLVHPEAFRSLIVGAGSFPVDVSQYQVGSVEELPRREWNLWQEIKNTYPNVPFIYSDYGCAHPVYDAYAQAFQGSCSIKYTAGTTFYIFRGSRSDLHKDGFGQYITHCQNLIKRPFYPSPNFSWADNFISDCAEEKVGTGNAETWVKVSQNHHFALVLSLL